MNGARVAAQVAAAFAEAGDNATLVRLAGRTLPRHELPVRAVLVFLPPTTPIGGVVQEQKEVRISNKEIAASDWPAPIRRGDQIILGGATYTIQGVRTAAPGGVPTTHFLQVMGQAA